MSGQIGVACFGGIVGIFVDKYSPRRLMTLGGLLIFLGYATVYSFYTHGKGHRSSPLYRQWAMALALVYGVIGLGNCLVFNCSIKLATVTFPQNRGAATSIPMSAFGLSAFFFSTVAGLLFPGNTKGFLLTLAIVTSMLIAASLIFVPNNLNPRGYSLLENDATLVSNQQDQNNNSIEDERAHITDGASGSNPTVKTADDHISISKLVRAPAFWELFCLLALISGAGQMYIYSCGHMVDALMLNQDANLIQKTQALQVGVISVANFTGRILSGNLSDLFHHHWDIPRKWLLVLASLVSMAGHVMATFIGDPSHLYVVSMAVGLSYGMIYGVYPSIVSDTFGLRHFSKAWGWVACSQVFVAYILELVFGAVYDSNVDTSLHEKKPHTCTLGLDCYRSAFYVSVGVGFAAFVLATISALTSSSPFSQKQSSNSTNSSTRLTLH